MENRPAFPFIKKEEKEEGREEAKLPVSWTSLYSVGKYHIYIQGGRGTASIRILPLDFALTSLKLVNTGSPSLPIILSQTIPLHNSCIFAIHFAN